MDGQATWRNQDHVDLHILAVRAKLRIEDFGGIGDSPEPFQIDRLLQIFDLRPRLDLDKGDQCAAFRDQIDLTAPVRPISASPSGAGSGRRSSRPVGPALPPPPVSFLKDRSRCACRSTPPVNKPQIR